MNALVDEAIDVLKIFKNVVIEGPPGTGKTFVVDSIAGAWEKHTGRTLAGNGSGAYAITFHPSTSYEDFIEGLRFDEIDKKFTAQDGFLKRIIAEALANPDQDFLVLLDELNRANVPKVLGDVLVCMESSKRSKRNSTTGEWDGGFEVSLPYSGALFSMPENLYILGTMNTSDRSIAPLDSALRRRFAFIRAEALPADALRAAILQANGPEALDLATPSIDALSNLNALLAEEIGPDALLGHSYLFDIRPDREAPTSPYDSVKSLLSEAPDYARAFWLEIPPHRNGGSGNQVNLPGPAKNKPGIVDQFFPLTGLPGKDPARRDEFAISWAGKTWHGNILNYNPGGSNWKLQLQGKAGDNKLSAYGPTFLGKIMVWFISGLGEVSMEILEGTRANKDALRVASGGKTWVTTNDENQREYGTLLPAEAIRPEDSLASSSARLVWRYSILPQLIDTASQLGGSQLFSSGEDGGLAGPELHGNDSAARLEQFEIFLGSIGLKVASRGFGMGQQLTVEDVPIIDATERPFGEDDNDSDAHEQNDNQEPGI